MPQFLDQSDQVTDKCFLWLLRVNNEKGFFTSFWFFIWVLSINLPKYVPLNPLFQVHWIWPPYS